MFWLFLVYNYIFLFSDYISLGYQVVYPVINGEGEGREPHVGNFI